MRSMNSFFASGLLVISSVSFAADRLAAIKGAEQLQETGLELGQLAQYQCGCPNTAQTLYDVANLAIDVEMEARFGTSQDATDKLKDVVRKYKSLQGYLKNVANQAIKLRIKRESQLAVNELGKAVMGANWIIVRERAAYEVVNGATVEVDYFEGLDENLSLGPDTEF